MTEPNVDTTTVAPVSTEPTTAVPPVVLPSDTPKETLLAGKYKTPEDLEKGYIELQKAFSGRKPDETVTPPPDPSAATEAALVTKAGLDMDVLTKEYTETGELSAASLTALEAIGVTKDVVSAYFRGQEALAQREIAEVQEFAGGKAAYESMVQWAGQNMSNPEIAAYNGAMNGDAETRKMAIEALKSKYVAKTGSNPKVIHGQGDPPAPEGYGSKAQMTTDMKDPRYAKDAAFRAAVERKIAKTTVF
jgi:hypothetical protein